MRRWRCEDSLAVTTAGCELSGGRGGGPSPPETCPAAAAVSPAPVREASAGWELMGGNGGASIELDDSLSLVDILREGSAGGMSPDGGKAAM